MVEKARVRIVLDAGAAKGDARKLAKGQRRTPQDRGRASLERKRQARQPGSGAATSAQSRADVRRQVEELLRDPRFIEKLRKRVVRDDQGLRDQSTGFGGAGLATGIKTKVVAAGLGAIGVAEGTRLVTPFVREAIQAIPTSGDAETIGAIDEALGVTEETLTRARAEVTGTFKTASETFSLFSAFTKTGIPLPLEDAPEILRALRVRNVAEDAIESAVASSTRRNFARGLVDVVSQLGNALLKGGVR